jgi:DNA polymerase V
MDRPVGVLSNNDGCVVARSQELKDAQIPMGAPYFKYKKQLSEMNAVIVSSNYALYEDMSERVMSILKSLCPKVEVYSIDEAWLDLGFLSEQDISPFSEQISQTILKQTGIPVSIGISSTKVLSKIANKLCKSMGYLHSSFYLTSGSDEILKRFPVEDIWGIGRRLSSRLKEEGICNAFSLKRSDPRELKKRYSILMERLIRELNGLSCFDFEESSPKKQIISSRSFGMPVVEEQHLLEALTTHLMKSFHKLRKQGGICRRVTIMIRTKRHIDPLKFYASTFDIVLDTPISDPRHVTGNVREILSKIYKAGFLYAKAGVVLSEIFPENSFQKDLFSREKERVNCRVMKLFDDLKSRYGRDILTLGSEGINPVWSMKRTLKTPAYTTSWRELLSVK